MCKSLETSTDHRRERTEDGKSLANPQTGVLSKAYEEFPDPLAKDRRGGFDVHIYHYQVRTSLVSRASQPRLPNESRLTRADKSRPSRLCESVTRAHPPRM